MGPLFGMSGADRYSLGSTMCHSMDLLRPTPNMRLTSSTGSLLRFSTSFRNLERPQAQRRTPWRRGPRERTSPFETMEPGSFHSPLSQENSLIREKPGQERLSKSAVHLLKFLSVAAGDHYNHRL